MPKKLIFINLWLQVVDFYTHSDIDLRLYMVMLLIPLILLNLIRNLKWLAPFSMIANMLMAAGVGITFYYVFSDLPSLDSRPHFASFHQLPLFFGTAIFALEGIGVVSSMSIFTNCAWHNKLLSVQIWRYSFIFRRRKKTRNKQTVKQPWKQQSQKKN